MVKVVWGGGINDGVEKGEEGEGRRPSWEAVIACQLCRRFSRVFNIQLKVIK